MLKLREFFKNEEFDKMKVKELVGKGYFPYDELPPAFNTEKLGLHALSIDSSYEKYKNGLSKKKRKKLNFKSTECIKFTVPKVGLKRRIYGIPNPIHQVELSKIIAFNWNKIKNIYSGSDISASIPIKDPNNKKAVVTEYSFKLFKEKCLECSFNKKFELKTDIAKYFPSIYTHSISWAIHTKPVAKDKRNDFTLIGNLLDKAVRSGQSGQTNGIPIGPDTSRIIAEILGCTFDKKLNEKFDNIVGYRFVDDCIFYFSSYSEAETVFKCFETMLTDYGLDINEEKTVIQRLPYSFESEWSILLSNHPLRYTKKLIKGKTKEKSDEIRIKAQRKDLKNFISLAFKLTNENPRDSVLKFAVKQFHYIKIFKENWSLFESLLFKMGTSEPVILPEILKLLLKYETWIDYDKLEQFTTEILWEHHYKGHNFEISWGLWIAKTFSIHIDDKLAEKIIKSRDVISIIICLDMIECDLISNSLDLSELESELTDKGLYNEWWLLVYESIRKGWLNPDNPNLLQKSNYFKELDNRDIEFYDSLRQVEIEGSEGEFDIEDEGY